MHEHLRHRAVPLSQDAGGQGRLLRVWSAASASLLLAALGVVLIWRGEDVLQEVLVIAVVMLVVEATFRGRLLALAWSVALDEFAGVAVMLVVVGNLQLGVGILLLLAALYMASQTLREGWLHR